MKRNSTTPFTPTSPEAVPASALPKLLESYLLVCDIEQHSPRTMESRRWRLGHFVTFIESRRYDEIGLSELRAFFHHLTVGHKEPGGRFGMPHLKKPLAPGTIKSFFSSLRAFFNWLVREETITDSPMRRMKPPIDRPDQVQPFSEDECRRLLAAAKKMRNALRDEVVLSLLLDCGIRATELTSLRIRDIDLSLGQLTVDGKGGKKRYIPFSREAKKAIYLYLRAEPHDDDEALILSERGVGDGMGMGRDGLRHLVGRIGKAAGIKDVHPHRFRHTFAVMFLRAGGSEFSLQTLLGHTSLIMTRRYVALCQADVTRAHQQFSPLSRLRGGKSR